MTSSLPGSLIEAYRNATYRVEASQAVAAFELSLDQRCAPLAQLMAADGKDCAAFMTAHNPGSEPANAIENGAAQRRLRAALANCTVRVIAGCGGDPTGRWPDEESFLVLGLRLDSARRIGHAFGQNALIWAGADAVPRLILLR